MGSTIRRLCNRSLAAIGGVALVAAVTTAPGVSNATPSGDGHADADPDDAGPGPSIATDGTSELCSGLFGFGKAFVEYDVLVDGEAPQVPFVRGTDYELVLTGDLDDDGTTESCRPADLTQADWDSSVFGPTAAGVPFPGPNHLVLPSVPSVVTESVRPVDVSPTPFTLSIVDVAKPYAAVMGEVTLGNTVNPSAVLATAEKVAVTVVGEAGVAAIQSAVADTQCNDRTEARDAAVELFDSMILQFQDDWLSFGGGEPENCNSFFEFVVDYYPERWVNYLGGTGAPALFNVAVPTPDPGPGPAPVPEPETPAVSPRFTG